MVENAYFIITQPRPLFIAASRAFCPLAWARFTGGDRVAWIGEILETGKERATLRTLTALSPSPRFLRIFRVGRGKRHASGTQGTFGTEADEGGAGALGVVFGGASLRESAGLFFDGGFAKEGEAVVGAEGGVEIGDGGLYFSI